MKRPTAVIDARWAQQAHDAFRACFDNTAAQTKTMAAWLQEKGFWSDTMSIDSAVSKMRHCVNGTHQERFATPALMALCTQFQMHDLLRFWANSSGFDLVPIPDAQFDAQLVASFDARLSAIASQLADLQGVSDLMAARNTFDAKQEARAAGASVERALFVKALQEGPL